MITHQNAKDWLPIVQAMANGKQIQICTVTGEWKTIASLSDCNFQLGDYCIAPEPRRVPLTADDIPAVCWVRFHFGRCNDKGVLEIPPTWLVTAVTGNGIEVSAAWSTFDELMTEGAEYSTDRKNWKPCWKEVQE